MGSSKEQIFVFLWPETWFGNRENALLECYETCYGRTARNSNPVLTVLLYFLTSFISILRRSNVGHSPYDMARPTGYIKLLNMLAQHQGYGTDQ